MLGVEMARSKPVSSRHKALGDLSGPQWAVLQGLADGLNNQQIAAATGVNRLTVGEWRKDPIIRQLLATMRRDEWEASDQHHAVQEQLSRIRALALTRLEEVLAEVTRDGDEVRVARPEMLRAISDALDRTGIPKRSEVAVSASMGPGGERPYQATPTDALQARLQLLEGGKA
jgi:hypothetical protein